MTCGHATAQGGAVADPCLNLCRMDASRQYCQGCWRTVREIGLWSRMSDEQKSSTLEAVQRRRSGGS